MNKYKLTSETINVCGRILYRIEALISFGIVNVGEKGGFIESESNLSHEDKAWVSGEAEVFGEAWVYGEAILKNAGHNKTKTYLTIGPLGDNRFITLEKEAGIINAGCFSGSIKEFEKAVKEKYGTESDYYLIIKLFKQILKK